LSALAAVPHASDMAETLLVLAGGNAGNAARYFAEQFYRNGDIDAALVWSQVVEASEVLLQALPLLAQSSGQCRGRPGETDPYDSVKLSSVGAKVFFAEQLPDEVPVEMAALEDGRRLAA
jgi:hypothetical protein